jgi:hypothetical protein
LTDKRKFQRIKFDVFVIIDSMTYGHAKNLSIGGMRVTLSDFIDKGNILHMQFTLPGSSSVNLIGSVAWCEKDSNEKYSCGIEFLDFSNNDREAVRAYVEKCGVNGK